jgi:hypothetical protein
LVEVNERAKRKRHLDVIDDPRVKHMGVVTAYEHARRQGKGDRPGGEAQRDAARDRTAGADGRRAHGGDPGRVGVDERTIADLEARKAIEQAA